MARTVILRYALALCFFANICNARAGMIGASLGEIQQLITLHGLEDLKETLEHEITEFEPMICSEEDRKSAKCDEELDRVLRQRREQLLAQMKFVEATEKAEEKMMKLDSLTHPAGRELGAEPLLGMGVGAFVIGAGRDFVRGARRWRAQALIGEGYAQNTQGMSAADYRDMGGRLSDGAVQAYHHAAFSSAEQIRLLTDRLRQYAAKREILAKWLSNAVERTTAEISEYLSWQNNGRRIHLAPTHSVRLDMFGVADYFRSAIEERMELRCKEFAGLSQPAIDAAERMGDRSYPLVATDNMVALGDDLIRVSGVFSEDQLSVLQNLPTLEPTEQERAIAAIVEDTKKVMDDVAKAANLLEGSVLRSPREWPRSRMAELESRSQELLGAFDEAAQTLQTSPDMPRPHMTSELVESELSSALDRVAQQPEHPNPMFLDDWEASARLEDVHALFTEETERQARELTEALRDRETQRLAIGDNRLARAVRDTLIRSAEDFRYLQRSPTVLGN